LTELKEVLLLQELVMLSEADIRELGVRNGAHRARLVSSLVMLRDIEQQRQGKTTMIHSPLPHPLPGWSLVTLKSLCPPVHLCSVIQ